MEVFLLIIIYYIIYGRQIYYKYNNQIIIFYFNISTYWTAFLRIYFRNVQLIQFFMS